MRTFRLTLEYDGSKFSGWQSQLNARSVQGDLQRVADELFGVEVDLQGAGRTDALELAIRKIGGRDGEDAAEALTGELLTTAAEGRFGASGWAELVALPVALPVRDLPDAALIGESFSSSGILEGAVEVRFLPGWLRIPMKAATYSNLIAATLPI